MDVHRRNHMCSHQMRSLWNIDDIYDWVVQRRNELDKHSSMMTEDTLARGVPTETKTEKKGFVGVNRISIQCGDSEINNF